MRFPIDVYFCYIYNAMFAQMKVCRPDIQIFVYITICIKLLRCGISCLWQLQLYEIWHGQHRNWVPAVQIMKNVLCCILFLVKQLKQNVSWACQIGLAAVGLKQHSNNGSCWPNVNIAVVWTNNWAWLNSTIPHTMATGCNRLTDET